MTIEQLRQIPFEEATLHDVFFAHALGGLCANANRRPGDSTKSSQENHVKFLAIDAMQIADEAMRLREQ